MWFENGLCCVVIYIYTGWLVLLVQVESGGKVQNQMTEKEREVTGASTDIHKERERERGRM